MLGYCEYELGHPDDSYEAASIIWANVILNNTDLLWGEKKAEIYLFTDDKDYPTFEVNVHRYAKNMIDSGISQFDSFSFMTERLLIDMLLAGYQIEELQRLKSIVYECTNDNNGSYSERFITAAGELYKANKENLTHLHDMLNGGE
ncbi:hypothetical protein DKT75_17615 [Leucothrix arctica]|uniref:Uncharacterized protein n=2 Tax=Leucothrix arctica TaxID=1481894 RepID=A0A317C572_9GAMM|nr:hypothetical protein DKT75_17615 [Leucothrix arctica]